MPETDLPETDLVDRLRASSDEALETILRAADDADVRMHETSPPASEPSTVPAGSMEVIHLGALGCRFGMLAGGAGGLLVRTPAGHILIDPGPAALPLLLKLAMQRHFDFSALRAVVCTHLHPDHYGNVIPALEGMLAAGVPGPLFIANATVLDRFSSFSPYHLNQVERVALAHPETQGHGRPSHQVADVELHATPTLHLEETGKTRTAIGIAARAAAGTLWYTSDTNLYPGLTATIHETVGTPDVIIAHADASNLDQPASRTAACHLQTRDVIALASDLEPRHIIIQHYDLAYSSADYRIAQAIWLQRRIHEQQRETRVLPGASGLRVRLNAQAVPKYDFLLDSPDTPAVRSYYRASLH